MAAEAEWFMDYRNSDGSVAEMCGNGVRVFARYLQRAGLAGTGDLAVATRAGVRAVHIAKDAEDGTPGDITVQMGRAVLPGGDVSVGRRTAHAWPAVQRQHGQPARRRLRRRPGATPATCCAPPPSAPAAAYPAGANVEFVVDRGPAPCGDAGARARLRRDPLLRHRRLRGDGRRRPQGRLRPRASPASPSPTPSMCRADGW